jgi:two-component system, OmpR family, phosphate regulon sensor histidine kinase PhoR
MKSLAEKVVAITGEPVAAKIVLLYSTIAAIWIFFSDRMLAGLATDQATLIRLETYKGWLFVVVTALLLYWLIRRYVTALRQNSEDLLNQFSQLTTIFDSLNALVYVADMESHRLLYINRYGSAQFGADWQEKSCYELLQGNSSPCDSCTDQQLVKDGVLLPPQISEHQNSVTGRWYQCIDRAIKWTDGRLARLEIAIDISERKGMEQMREELISAVSHEMRTPLTAMMGFSEFLLTNKVDEEQQRNCLETIYKETERLNELIGNFLDLQRIKARRVIYRFAAVAAKPLLQDAALLFDVDRTRHRLVIDTPAELPPVRGDEARLHQVLTNLISNAVKYSPPGTQVTLGARQSGESVDIWVGDEGVGIPAEMQEMIFDRFFRLDNTDRRLVGGAGLGLALVKEIVTAHEGRVWVESVVGKGSTFHIMLPIMNGAAAPGNGNLNP